MNQETEIVFYEFIEERCINEIITALGALYGVFLERNLIKRKPQTGFFNFDYAGFAANKDTLVIVLPKYLHKEISNIVNNEERKRRQFEESKKLFRLLKREEEDIRNRKTNIEIAAADFLNESLAGYTNELAIAEFILNDYQMNGLWFYSSKKILIDADGEIDWELTINNIDAVVFNGSPHYFNTYNNSNEFIIDSLITQIHKYAVNYCNKRYAFLLDLELAEMDAAKSFDDLGDTAFLIYTLEKQLRVTYREREILLLKSLIELIEIASSQSDEFISLYGRRDFEQVWETALQYCFGHNNSLREFLFPLPEWFELKSASFLPVNINDALKPDVLREITVDGKKLLIILDAKYYLINFSSKGTFPPIGDIIKEYFYEAAVTRKEKVFVSEGVINAFVFPTHSYTPTTWFEVGGHAKLDNDLFNFSNGTLSIKKPVLNFYMNADLIFERYTNYRPFSEDEIKEIIDASKEYLRNPILVS